MKLTVANASFAYKTDEPIFNDISFSVSEGDLLAILGPNGAGKTTLLRCIMDFLHLTSGKASLDDKDIKDIPFKELWQKISYVPQARNVSATYTVMESILLGRNSHIGMFSQPNDTDLNIVKSIMSKLHIENLKDKKCSEISGGELQMVLIGRALASNPQILILDEPESNLDFRNQLIVLDTMSALTLQGMTCIFNTHYPAHALTRANKSLILSKKGEYIYGDTANVITESNISKAFGVKTVIGEIETPENIYKSILPLKLNKDNDSLESIVTDNFKIAIISIIANDSSVSEKINSYLHEYSQYLIGRMGMPYRKNNIYIINVTLDAPEHIINSLIGKLNILPGISVKTTYAHE